MAKIAIYGSAFDPPHLGHMDVVTQLLEKFDHVWLTPSAKHAFGKQMSDFATRVKMLELITAEQGFAAGRIKINTIEQQLLQQQPNRKAVYSYDLLTEIQQLQPNDQLTLVIGPDNAKPATWQKFYRHQDIEQQFSLFIAKERLPVRSTLCRELMANNASCEQLSKMLGQQLAQWICQQNQQ